MTNTNARTNPHDSGSQVMGATETECLRLAAEIIAPVPDDDPADELSILASRLTAFAAFIEGLEAVRRAVAPELRPRSERPMTETT